MGRLFQIALDVLREIRPMFEIKRDNNMSHHSHRYLQRTGPLLSVKVDCKNIEFLWEKLL